jgi:hypothetical protein
MSVEPIRGKWTSPKHLLESAVAEVPTNAGVVICIVDHDTGHIILFSTKMANRDLAIAGARLSYLAASSWEAEFTDDQPA